MKTLIKQAYILLALSFAPVLVAHAQEVITDSPLKALQSDWAKANYSLDGDAQIQAFEALIQKAEQSVTANPEDAALQTWSGIINSTFAGVKGGLGALKYAKIAKVYLEEAIKLDEKVLDGSAVTSLGTLYFKVPGWPVGFGDGKKAAKLLAKGLEINPDGIDSNYFYADYLLDKKEYAKAEDYLKKALAAEPRAGREVADQGRRNEIQLALVEVRKHL